jgi:hypothetical protein
MKNFFTVDVIPDIVNGDVSNIIASNKAHIDIGINDILFDWTAVDIPRGTSVLRTVYALVNGEDSSTHASGKSGISLFFAKSTNGQAPQSMGTVGTAFSSATVGESANGYRDKLIGNCLLDPDAHIYNSDSFAFGFSYNTSLTLGPGNTGTGSVAGLPIIMDFEPESGSHVGFDKLYVMGVLDSVARGFQTGVIVNGAITSDTEDTIAVDGVKAHTMFSIGDTVYVHDVDSPLGTVKSVTASTITLNAPIAGGTDLADDDELVNANPIRIRLGFER